VRTEQRAGLRVVLLEGDASEISPLADLRAVCCVRTGAMSLLERLRHRERWRGDISVVGVVCAPERAAIVAETTGLAVNAFDSFGDDVVGVLAHAVTVPEEALALKPNHALVDRESGQILALRTHGRALEGWPSEHHRVELSGRVISQAIALLTRPWSVRTHRDMAMTHDFAMLTGEGPGTIPRMSQFPGIAMIADCSAGRCPYMHPSAKVGIGSILDCEAGSIVIDEGAVVRPGAILIGPCYVGKHSTVLERATIRPQTAIGPWCKVNGEVGGTIFQGYSNKSHDGYLGDSWVGEWVNLGAGTTSSNLLNTYGEIMARATPGGKHEQTGLQFLGAIVGDHIKTAICTRIMTGSVLHTGSMFATTAAVQGCVEGFIWATDEGSKPYRINKFLEVGKVAMKRRGKELTPVQEAVLRELSERGGRGGMSVSEG